jgi:hypothetical protein
LSTEIKYLSRTQGIAGYYISHKSESLRTVLDIPGIRDKRNQYIPVSNFLKLWGVRRQECCENTHLDDMQDYVVKMGPDSVLPTSQCKHYRRKPVM